MSAEVSSSSGLHGRRKVLLFAGLMTAMFLSALDQAVFGTALPTIVGDLNGVEHMLWVTTAYMLAMTVMLPVYGKLGDRTGHKRLFAWAIVLFVAGSVVGALAPDMTWLIVGRAIQGVGGGGLMIQAMAIMTALLSPKERAKLSWMFGIVFMVPSLVGPVVGGWLTDPHHILWFDTSWRWTFWINLPLGVLALAAAVAFVPRLSVASTRAKVDYLGIGLLALTSVAIVMATSWGGSTYPWGSPVIISLFVGAVVCAITFIFVERRAEDPVMPAMLFRSRNFVLVTVAGLVLGLVMMGTLVYLPTYLQMVTGASPTESGYQMLPMVIALVVTVSIVGVVVGKTGRYKWAPIAGMVVTAVTLLLLSMMTPAMPFWQILCYLGLLGVGLGMSMQVLMLIVQNEFDVRHAGTAISTNTYFRTMGMSLGSAIVGALFVSNLQDQIAGRLPGVPSDLSGFDGVGSLTPALVQTLPRGLQDIIISSYNDALTPVFLWVLPLVLVTFVVMLFLHEKPLDDEIEQQIAAAAA